MNEHLIERKKKTKIKEKLGGIRLTSQRKTILETVQGMCTHPTADEVYQKIRGSLPKVSLATVYRNLENLSEAGFIRKVEHAGTAKRFDGNLAPHQHIRCIRCGTIEDVHESPEMTEMVAKQIQTDFTIVGHLIEIQGICPNCQKSMEA